MNSEDLQRLKDEVEPMLPDVLFSSSNLNEAFQKHSVSEPVEVEVRMSLNSQQFLQQCTKVYTTCPTGAHRSSPCVHLVNC
jgi:methylthioribose-1-phosphate isomerase